MKKIIKIFISLCYLFLAVTSFASVDCADTSNVTITSDGSDTQQDFIDAVSCADAGSIINVGSGTWTISNVVTVNKNLTFQGNGTSNTILTCNVNMAFTLSSTGFTRFTKFKFNGNIGSGYKGAIYITDGNKRIDNCEFNITGRHGIYISSDDLVNILIDNNLFDVRGINITGNSGYWTTSSDFAPGTNNAVYIEDNTFNSTNVEIMDNNYGGMYVFRHNTVNGGNVVMHGADSGDRAGGHAIIYENTFDFGNSCYDIFMNFRGGEQIIVNNEVINTNSCSSKNRIKLQNWRSCYTENSGSLPFDTANQYDCEDGSQTNVPQDQLQESDSTGWTCKDQIGLGPNQVRKGSYEWENTFEGGDTDFSVDNVGGCSNPSTNDHLQVGRDFFSEDTGITRVTTAPTTCSTKYYAVWYDEDNDSVFDTGIPSGSPETLYQCDGANYQEFWTPYSYPHPLRNLAAEHTFGSGPTIHWGVGPTIMIP